MLILAIIAIIVIPPEKLPELARQLARFISDLKRSTAGMWDDIKLDAQPKHQAHVQPEAQPEPEEHIQPEEYSTSVSHGQYEAYSEPEAQENNDLTTKSEVKKT